MDASLLHALILGGTKLMRNAQAGGKQGATRQMEAVGNE